MREKHSLPKESVARARRYSAAKRRGGKKEIRRQRTQREELGM